MGCASSREIDKRHNDPFNNFDSIEQQEISFSDDDDKWVSFYEQGEVIKEYSIVLDYQGTPHLPHDDNVRKCECFSGVRRRRFTF